jgi:uncharacterized protein YjbI with pentapeptide repeats
MAPAGPRRPHAELADLGNADLTGAHLKWARLEGTLLEGAQR